MRYMLLICSDEKQEAEMSPDEMGPLLEGFMQFSAEVQPVCEGSNRLQPTTAATTVRVRDGKTVTTDGPFAETKEAIGGYYMIDVANLDEAIAWASEIPSATYGSVEIRPVWEPEEY